MKFLGKTFFSKKVFPNPFQKTLNELDKKEYPEFLTPGIFYSVIRLYGRGSSVSSSM